MKRSSGEQKEIKDKRKVLIAISATVVIVGMYFSVRAIFGASNEVLDAALLGPEGSEIVLPIEATTTETSIYRGNVVVSSKKEIVKKEISAKKESSSSSSVPKSSTWCEWGEEEASTTKEIILSETNKSWVGIKNISEEDVDTSGWQIISSDQRIKIKLAGKKLETGRSYHVARTDAGDDADLESWLRLFRKDCGIVAEVKAPQKAEIIISVATTSEVSTSSNIPTPIVFVSSTPIINISPLPSTEIIVSQVTSSTPTSTEQAPSPLAATSSVHLVIAVVETGSAEEGNYDLIKIYNPMDATTDISGWKLRKRTSSGSEASIRVLPKGSQIAGNSYFVWANSNYPTEANVTSTQTLADDNSLALLSSEDELIDAVGWGKGKEQYKEGNIYPMNPEAGKALMRKFETGIVRDTNDNSEDFEIK
jgi:hypothetical protein